MLPWKHQTRRQRGFFLAPLEMQPHNEKVGTALISATLGAASKGGMHVEDATAAPSSADRTGVTGRL